MNELDKDQIAMLKKAFDGFDHEKKGAINCDVVATILDTMGQAYNAQTLKELIDKVDADRSGTLEFKEFVTLVAKFILEDDA